MNTEKLKKNLAALEKQRGTIKGGNAKMLKELDGKIASLKETIAAHEKPAKAAKKEVPAKTSKPAPAKTSSAKPAKPAPAKTSAPAPKGVSAEVKKILEMEVPRHNKHYRLHLAGVEKKQISELTGATPSNVGRDILQYKKGILKLPK